MKTIKSLLIVSTLVAGFACLTANTQNAEAAYRLRRSYYSSWSYYPQRTYYYRYYYYKPTVSYTTYKYHYCIYYTNQPRYVYYYNPTRKVYWGRYDLEKKGYSMLDEKDRKGKLEDIPESAFPAPGKMPAIPESEDGATVPPIEPDDLPSKDAPKDAPKD